jgi:hypothetical protein
MKDKVSFSKQNLLFSMKSIKFSREDRGSNSTIRNDMRFVFAVVSNYLLGLGNIPKQNFDELFGYKYAEDRITVASGVSPAGKTTLIETIDIENKSSFNRCRFT